MWWVVGHVVVTKFSLCFAKSDGCTRFVQPSTYAKPEAASAVLGS